jgi:hypothetical protein
MTISHQRAGATTSAQWTVGGWILIVHQLGALLASRVESGEPRRRRQYTCRLVAGAVRRYHCVNNASVQRTESAGGGC